MWRRLLKYALVGTAAIFGLAVLAVGSVVVSYYFPPTYEASTALPESNSVVAVQLEPMHPWLAEYRRTLVLRTSGAPEQKVNMFADSGGYSRTQIYRVADKVFLVRGYFDAYLIDLATQTIAPVQGPNHSSPRYLGAFVDYGHKWEFLDAQRSPEQPLKAGG